jgi:hypothetical protein
MTSIIKVDNLQNQCGANIISESANVITIGASGDTVTLAAGASQSGFGRTGTVNWDTTAKTTGFTAVSGNGYFCDTTSAAFTVTLPAGPSAGDIVAVADYDGTAATNAITVGRNSSNINGDAADLIISKNYSAISFVYVDATAGWRSVDTSNVSDVVNPFIAATGGTISTCGDYKIHTFTGPGTFTVTNAGNASGSTSVDYLVVAGGAGGGGTYGANMGGGAGAGGYRESKATGAPWTASPLASSTSLPVSATAYPITVGAGGAAGTTCIPASRGNQGGNGVPSIFSTITSTGGGGGGGGRPIAFPTEIRGLPGGSGGGGSGGADFSPNDATRGSGNTPPTSPSQGNNGGSGGGTPDQRAGGGGGATAVGADRTPTTSGGGGAGAGTGINPSPTVGTPGPSPSLRYFAGGGGGGGAPAATLGPGGVGGGGAGGAVSPTSFGVAGTVNTGGGGGSAGFICSSAGPSGAGGSGIVVIRYKFQ